MIWQKFRYKIKPGISLRNVGINEIKIRDDNSFINERIRENCVIVQKYKDFMDYNNTNKYYLIPITVKLAFKNCAKISYSNNYLDYETDGYSTQEIIDKDYDGSFVNIVDDTLINNLANVIELCEIYLQNIETDIQNLDFIKIALDFYSQSLTKIHPTHQITYACLALEALYNTSSDKVLKQLKDRCSNLLKITDISIKNPSKIIQKAYEVRCSYVHGQNPLCCTDESLVEQILDIVRYSIILFLTLYSNRFIKNKLCTQNINLKSFINRYYLDNLDIMHNLKNEIKKYLKKLVG